MRTLVRGSLVTTLVMGLLLVGPGAQAACHAFAVTASPSTADEGVTVTLTISRDGAVNPSSVRVRTVDGTATGGSDFTVVDERVEFTSEVEVTREVQVTDDDEVEDDETFVVELSDGEGCEINPNFTYGSDTVTIADNDVAPQPTPTGTESPDDQETQPSDEQPEAT
ncbi:MAG TPA: Calx-beta domain-containing protein, partial [Nitriliruptorales bacterium]